MAYMDKVFQNWINLLGPDGMPLGKVLVKSLVDLGVDTADVLEVLVGGGAWRSFWHWPYQDVPYLKVSSMMSGFLFGV